MNNEWLLKGVTSSLSCWKETAFYSAANGVNVALNCNMVHPTRPDRRYQICRFNSPPAPPSSPPSPRGNTPSASAPSACLHPSPGLSHPRAESPVACSASSSDTRSCTGCEYPAPPLPRSRLSAQSTWERTPCRQSLPKAFQARAWHGVPPHGSFHPQRAGRSYTPPVLITPARDESSPPGSTWKHCPRRL